MSWRRRVGVVAVLAAGLGVTVLAPGWPSWSESARATSSDSDSAGQPAHAAPADAVVLGGQAGRGRAGVRVPPSWGVDEVRCGTAVADTVIYTSLRGARSCQVEDGGFSSVRVASAHDVDTSGFRADRAAGAEVLRADGAEGPYAVSRIVVRSEDAYFEIRSRSARLVDQISSSVHLVGPDDVFVPDLTTGTDAGLAGVSATPGESEVAARLSRMGLRLEVDYRIDSSPQRWSQVSSSPRAGSLVPVGSVVEVAYGDSGR